MTSRLRELTEETRARGHKALVPFLTAGYPDKETSLRLLVAAVRSGCRVVEVGIPFSDPMADGPVIQAASEQALAHGMTLAHALELVARASAEAPAGYVVMSYLNPILQMGVARFAERAARAGVCGVILPDVPLEESVELRGELARAGITLVYLVAPTSGEDRVAAIARQADGFLYLVSLTGVTGAREGLAAGLEDFVARARRASDLPLYVGFGVSTPEQAAAVVCSGADGVIIGSALIRIVRDTPDARAAEAAVSAFLARVAAAMAGASADAGNGAGPEAGEARRETRP
jgi:tryptophan synthase alpha chain